jgi:hypothetical protein
MKAEEHECRARCAIKGTCMNPEVKSGMYGVRDGLEGLCGADGDGDKQEQFPLATLLKDASGWSASCEGPWRFASGTTPERITIVAYFAHSRGTRCLAFLETFAPTDSVYQYDAYLLPTENIGRLLSSSSSRMRRPKAQTKQAAKTITFSISYMQAQYIICNIHEDHGSVGAVSASPLLSRVRNSTQDDFVFLRDEDRKGRLLENPAPRRCGRMTRLLKTPSQ